MPYYVFVTGGVTSSLGKGVCASSIAALIMAHGYRVRLKKLDPYLNVDPGTMSPYQHGECFVTADGRETDLDLGHYERFTGLESRASDNTTFGRIIQDVLREEREGRYLGETIQFIPHITDAIKQFITQDGDAQDFVICEVGGTVGDMEAEAFLEAIRQLSNEMGRGKSYFVHLTLLPYLETSGEFKTKPTQRSVRDLMEAGLRPNMLVCRTHFSVDSASLEKIALFCNVPSSHVIQGIDQRIIYDVVSLFANQGVDKKILKDLDCPTKTRPKLERWEKLSKSLREAEKHPLRLGIAGKYSVFKDSYFSLLEAIKHAAWQEGFRPELKFVDTESFDADTLKEVNALVVPGGFGSRGVLGKLEAIRYARENELPYLGICYGMQLALIEAARNMLGWKDANSTELDPKTSKPILYALEKWVGKGEARGLGGTMRLGSQEANILPDTKIFSIYGKRCVSDRHRHRFVVNDRYVPDFERMGFLVSMRSHPEKFVEGIEYPQHPFFIGLQGHPEFASTPWNPHPAFVAWIRAAVQYRRERHERQN